MNQQIEYINDRGLETNLRRIHRDAGNNRAIYVTPNINHLLPMQINYLHNNKRPHLKNNYWNCFSLYSIQ